MEQLLLQTSLVEQFLKLKNCCNNRRCYGRIKEPVAGTLGHQDELAFTSVSTKAQDPNPNLAKIAKSTLFVLK